MTRISPLIALVASHLCLANVRADEPFGIQLARGIEKIEKEHSNKASREDMTRWAIEGMFAKSWVKVPSEILESVRDLDLGNRQQLAAVLQVARDRLGDRRELLEEADLRASFDGIFAGVEPGGQLEWRSSYMTKKELENTGCVLLDFALAGVGLKLAVDRKTSMLQVDTPILDSPAYRAGIRAGDLITHITCYSQAEGQPEQKTVHSTKGMTKERAIELLVGRRGTRVTLTVIATPGPIVVVREAMPKSDE